VIQFNPTNTPATTPMRQLMEDTFPSVLLKIVSGKSFVSSLKFLNTHRFNMMKIGVRKLSIL